MSNVNSDEHDVPCEDCGSKIWTDWTLLPHELFNETCPGGNGYLCFDCFCKRRLSAFINKRVREAEINLMAKVLYNEGGLYKISKSTLQSYPKDNFEIANRSDVDGGEIYELNQLTLDKEPL